MPALKHHNSLLDILKCCISRNIISVLTNKSLTLLYGSLSANQKELKVIKKTDYDFATAMTVSETKVYVGDGKGDIDVSDLVLPEEDKLELHFGIQTGELSISKPKKKKVLSASKHPVTSLIYLQTLAYLISGHSNGELVIWHNNEIKKSLHLFKTSITGLTKLLKPKEVKIYQNQKIKTLHKY